MRLPSGATMRSITRITCSSFWKSTLVFSRRPWRSMYTCFGTVHHDFVDGVVLQQRLNGAEAEDFGGDSLEQASALDPGVRMMFSDFEYLAEDLLNLAAHFVGLGEVELGIKLRDNSLLDPVLQVDHSFRLMVGMPARIWSIGPPSLPCPSRNYARAKPCRAWVPFRWAAGSVPYRPVVRYRCCVRSEDRLPPIRFSSDIVIPLISSGHGFQTPDTGFQTFHGLEADSDIRNAALRNYLNADFSLRH